MVEKSLLKLIHEGREVVIDGIVVKSNYRNKGDKSFDPVRDIEEFHTRFGLFYDGKPRSLPEDIGRLRRKLLMEETKEYVEDSLAAENEKLQSDFDPGEYNVFLEKSLDALVDLAYVAVGTAHLHGFDFKEAWRRVHEANMKKVRAEREEESKRGSIYDVVKPEGWEPPSHIDLVEDNDMRPEPSL